MREKDEWAATIGQPTNGHQHPDVMQLLLQHTLGQTRILGQIDGTLRTHVKLSDERHKDTLERLSHLEKYRLRFRDIITWVPGIAGLLSWAMGKISLDRLLALLSGSAH